MTTGDGPAEVPIQLGETYDVPKPPSLMQKLRAKWDARRVRVGEGQPVQSAGEPGGDLASRIKVGSEVTADTSVIDAIKLGEPDLAVSRHVSAALNQKSAGIFALNLRRITASIVTHPQESYQPPEYYSQEDLIELADRWQLPLLVFRKNANHWLLALKPPEEYNEGTRVLAYDPLKNQEVWYPLNGRVDSADPIDLMRHFGYVNKQGIEELKDGSYNLSLLGDTELADHSGVFLAKQAKFQFNAYDCGPLCLFAAALREGIKPGWNAFKFAGREQLEKDTRVRINTREEILGTG
ncbi:hypothetical protein HYU94_02000 [Candidatus Daviesbacteria bacterium]|nr:hypothetical protein [Candidatus Daviesbacteria bacterium]